MPTPAPGEKEKDFVDRCVPDVIDEGTAKTPEQAAAICHSFYEEAKKKDPSMILSQIDEGIDSELIGGLLTISNP